MYDYFGGKPMVEYLTRVMPTHTHPHTLDFLPTIKLIYLYMHKN